MVNCFIIKLALTYLQLFLGLDVFGGRSGLFVQPTHDIGGRSAAPVFRRRSLFEELERRVSLNLELGPQFGLHCRVDLRMGGKNEWIVNVY